MFMKFTYQYLSEKCICVLLIISMLFVTETEIAGFPVYTFVLFIIVSVWMMVKVIYANREGQVFLLIKYPTDTAAIMVVLYVVLSIIVKLFAPAEEGGIDFSWHVQVLVLALLYLLLSAGIQFRFLYFDVILYSGLPITGIYLFFNLTDGWENSVLEAVFSDSGVWTSYFLLIDMIAVYAYCICWNKMRSLFYLLTGGLGFFALFLVQNVLSLWLMGIYFVAIPVMLRPTAVLVKKVMQIFFLYLFMLSNMSLIGEYTQIIRREMYYTLEHSVYLDLLIALGGIFFFYYWERIPTGIALERIVLRKMQKGYRFLLKMILLLFLIIVSGAGNWTSFTGGIVSKMFHSFAAPLAEAARQGESIFLSCFRRMEAVSGLFLLVCVALLMGRMYRNYQIDKPDTDILILISGIFFVQLLFWNPGIHNIVIYFYLLMMASFYKEEREAVVSVGIKAADLNRDIIGSGYMGRK